MDYLELNRKVYDLTADEFDKKILLRRKSDEQIVRKFISFIKKQSSVILDIGPGNGQMAKLISDHGYKVVGIEFSKVMAKVAKKNAPKIEMILDDFLTHDFGKKTFSGILAVAFIHLFPQDDCIKILGKIYNLLEDGGCAFISTTRHVQSSEGLFPKENFKDKPLRFRKKFTKPELMSLLKKEKFNILKYDENRDTEEVGKIWMNFVVQKCE